MSADLIIIVTAVLVATCCGLLGPFLVLRRVALMGDAVSHAVLPGIVAVFLLFQTRASFYVIVGAAFFAILCVLGIEALKSSGLLKADAAIGIVFPVLFSLGVLGIQQFASNIHLDLDATIYGEIAFAPLRNIDIFGQLIPRSIFILSCVLIVNLFLVILLWKELKVTTFDPEFSRTIKISPTLLSRILLIAVAITAVTSFESVGAILVVTMLIVPAATAYLLTDKLILMVFLSVLVGWISAISGYLGAMEVDASIAGAMGLVAALLFIIALIASPRYGLIKNINRKNSLEKFQKASVAKK